MNQLEFEARFGGSKAQPKSRDIISEIKTHAGELNVCSRIRSFVPILDWLPKYKFAANLHGDLVTGLTVGIMVVPQGMAYATLAGLEPVNGLYSCFFAAFFYMFFGTSIHVSIGTFAVASMMVGSLRAELVPDPIITNELINGTNVLKQVVHHVKGPIDFGFDVTPTMLTSALTFGVGICQIIMALCRLSFLTSYISDPLVSGFTTGAAVHVLTAQLDKAIGVKIKRHSGPGMILFMLCDLLFAIPRANLFTVGISAFGIVFLGIGRDYVNPWFKKRCNIPLPLELVLVIGAIILSRVLDLKNVYNVKIVDHIPEGMPLPALPQLELLQYAWMNVFSIAIVCFVFAISLEKIFAKKHKYKVEPNQELYALGFSSLLASFFPVYPFGASLSRSALCEMTGAKSQLHALFSSALLVIVILWIGPQLEPLPMAILACIVIVSLKSLFMQFNQLPRLWRISRFDFTIWLIAFVATACLDITYGLGISVLAVILFTVIKEQWPKFYELSRADSSTDIFRPTKFYDGLSNSHDPTGKSASCKVVQMWRFEAPLHFANSLKFVERVNDVLHKLCSDQAASIRDFRNIQVESVDSAKSLGKIRGLNSFDSSCTNEAIDTQTVSANSRASCRAANPLLIPQSQAQSADVPVKSKKLNKLLYARIAQQDDDAETKENQVVAACANCTNYNTNDITEATIVTAQTDLPNGTNIGGSETMAGSTSTGSSSTQIERFLVLDCGAISHVDSMGIEALSEVYKDAKRQNVVLYFAEFSDSILLVLNHCDFFKEVPKSNFFPVIREALIAINKPFGQ